MLCYLVVCYVTHHNICKGSPLFYNCSCCGPFNITLTTICTQNSSLLLCFFLFSVILVKRVTRIHSLLLWLLFQGLCQFARRSIHKTCIQIFHSIKVKEQRIHCKEGRQHQLNKGQVSSQSKMLALLEGIKSSTEKAKNLTNDVIKPYQK